MINVNSLILNLNKYALYEESFSDIDSSIDNGRRQRGNRLVGYYTGITRTPDNNVRTKWKVPSEKNPSTKYDVTVDIIVPGEGGLFSWAKGKWKPKEFKDILTKSEVQIHCSCPDFYWSGMAHNNMHQNTYANNTKTTVLTAQSNPSDPVVRDPNHENWGCKHLHRVFTLFPTNAFSIMSDVRKFKLLSSEPELISPTEELNGESQEVEKLTPVVNEEVKKPILDSLYSAGEELNKETQNNAKQLISSENEVDEDTINNDVTNETNNLTPETPDKSVSVEHNTINLIDDVMNEPEAVEPEVTPDDVQNIVGGTESDEEIDLNKKNLEK